MTRALVLTTLIAIDNASASWLRIGLVCPDSAEHIRPTARLTVPDRSWSWEGQLSKAPLTSGLVISQPIWIPGGREDELVVQIVNPKSAFAQEIRLSSSTSSQWFLDWSHARDDENKSDAPSPKPQLAPLISPNPFNISTQISLNLDVRTEVELVLVDILGRTAQVLYSGSLEAGAHSWTLDARSLASGTYFLSYRLSPGSSGATRLLLLK